MAGRSAGTAAIWASTFTQMVMMMMMMMETAHNTHPTIPHADHTTYTSWPPPYCVSIPKRTRGSVGSYPSWPPHHVTRLQEDFCGAVADMARDSADSRPDYINGHLYAGIMYDGASVHSASIHMGGGGSDGVAPGVVYVWGRTEWRQA